MGWEEGFAILAWVCVGLIIVALLFGAAMGIFIWTLL